MIRSLSYTPVVILASVVIGGCAVQGGLNTTYYQYVPHSYASKISGKAAIEMSESEQSRVFSGHPTSFTGGGSTLTLPLGQITREAAKLAFADIFTGGVSIVDLTPKSGYLVVIKPSVTQYSYEYNQLKNAGFAITPTATLTLSVSLLGADGKEIWEKSFDSGVYEGTTYFMSGSPGDEISKTTHRAIMKVMQEAADEISQDLSKKSADQAGQSL